MYVYMHFHLYSNCTALYFRISIAVLCKYCTRSNPDRAIRSATSSSKYESRQAQPSYIQYSATNSTCKTRLLYTL